MNINHRFFILLIGFAFQLPLWAQALTCEEVLEECLKTLQRVEQDRDTLRQTFLGLQQEISVKKSLIAEYKDLETYLDELIASQGIQIDLSGSVVAKLQEFLARIQAGKTTAISEAEKWEGKYDGLYNKCHLAWYKRPLLYIGVAIGATLSALIPG